MEYTDMQETLKELNIDIDRVYSGKTRDYFKEIISLYKNKNYRSAIVMLYSLLISDLYYKLQDLEDIYNDEKAKEILTEITEIREKNQTSPEWEKLMIERIKGKTSFLDNHMYDKFDFLKKERNICAHPEMNYNLNLYTPNNSTVAGYIKDIYEGVFVKPPIFINNIVNSLTEDLKEHKYIYESNRDLLHNHITNTYLSRITDDMLKKLFKAFWKLTFKSQDEDCRNNRYVLFRALKEIIDYKKELLINIIKNNEYYTTQILINDDAVFKYLIFLCTYYYNSEYNIYTNFNDDFKSKIKSKIEIEEHFGYDLISWFMFDDFDSYKEFIKNKLNSKSSEPGFEVINNYMKNIDYKISKWFNTFIKATNNIDLFFDILSEISKYVASFDVAKEIYYKIIYPNFDLLNNKIENIDRLLNILEKNQQYHWCWNIMGDLNKRIDKEKIDLSIYPNIMRELDSNR